MIMMLGRTQRPVTKLTMGIVLAHLCTTRARAYEDPSSASV